MKAEKHLYLVECCCGENSFASTLEKARDLVASFQKTDCNASGYITIFKAVEIEKKENSNG